MQWQELNSRLLLPLFVLWAPLVGAAVAYGRSQKMVPAVCGVLIVMGLPWLLYTAQRPLFGAGNVVTTSREDLLFARVPYLHEPFDRLSEIVHARGIGKLGVIGTEAEYLLWHALERAGPLPRIEYVQVLNSSRVLSDDPPFSGFIPEAVAALPPYTRRGTRPEIKVGGRWYDRIWSEVAVALYAAR